MSPTVDVTLAFNYEDQYWTRLFKVEPGTTILQLKKEILSNPGGTKQDIDSFELRLLGQRVSDAEEIYQEHTLDFEYLGPDEGAKRANEDVSDQRRLEQEKVEAVAAFRRKSQQASKTVTAASTPAPKRVQAAANQATEDLVVNVVINAELGMKQSFKVARGKTISFLKELLCAEDPTGATTIDSFGMGTATASGAVVALADSTTLSEKHQKLQVTDPYVPSSSSTSVTTPAEPPVMETIPGVCIWRVVGGAAQGGILVREGRETKSTQLAERLSKGSIVEQVDLVGERLRYLLITGSGPSKGWVSLTAGGKELLTRQAAESPEAFTFDRAVALQKELRDRFAAAKFQSELDKLQAAFPTKKGADFANFMKRRGHLVFVEQMEVIPRYGLEGSQKGVGQMMTAFTPHMGSPITKGLNDEISKLLRA